MTLESPPAGADAPGGPKDGLLGRLLADPWQRQLLRLDAIWFGSLAVLVATALAFLGAQSPPSGF